MIPSKIKFCVPINELRKLWNLFLHSTSVMVEKKTDREMKQCVFNHVIHNVEKWLNIL